MNSLKTGTGFLMFTWICLAACATENTPSCAALHESDCLDSAVCTLVKAEEKPPAYVCREASNECEIGFRQNAPDMKNSCESKPGCKFDPGLCYCPPHMFCVCAGGAPPQCLPSK